MIITLQDAQLIDSALTQSDLDAYESTIRQLSNNKFHHKNIKNTNLHIDSDTITSSDELIGYRIGDTIEIIGTKFNDGLRVIEGVIDEHSLKVEVTDNNYLFKSSDINAFIVKVDYPPDIISNLKEILKYKAKMVNKIGIKSESLARKSTTYFDVNGSDNIEGIPSSFWAFIKKYRRIRW